MIDPKDNDEAPERSAERRRTRCLSEESVLAFAGGRLPEAELPAAHEHLDHCDVCQQLLCEAAHALATAATAPLHGDEELGWNRMFQPGTLIGGRYLIRRFVARGGMGEVYEAFDTELQERVALKTITSTACDNACAVRLLKAEVQLARRVSHPNVCRIYDFGTHVMGRTGSQISFLTMEFVEGETLGQRVRLSGAVPIPEARRLGRELLRGLSAAHDAGVLHRDFKSDNVMLRYDPSDESSPLIMDFGLARAFDHDIRDGNNASNPTLVGTHGYIAPEQLEGCPHSTASDVYALGIVWFELLTGELPFDSNSFAAAVLERLHKPAPAPSSKNPLVPSDLDEIVLGCLRRSPKDRFRTAAEALTALDELESRARAGFEKRRLVPIVVAAALGGIAALFALTPATHPLPALVPVRTLNAAVPAAPEARAAALATLAPELGATAGVAAPAPRATTPPHSFSLRNAAPQKHGPRATTAPEVPRSPAPGPAAGATPNAPRGTSGWEDPFSPNGPAELLVDVHSG